MLSISNNKNEEEFNKQLSSEKSKVQSVQLLV